MALADFQDLVDGMVRDDSGTISATDRDAAIVLAVLRYSQDRPRVLTADVVSAEGGLFLDVPAGWEAGFTTLRGVEYPIDQDSAATLSGAQVEPLASGERIRLPEAVAAGATVRLRFTVPHAVDSNSDTVPAWLREAVALLAAAHLLESLAAARSGDVDSSIGAADVNRATPAQQYAARARALRARYADTVGKSSGLRPAGAIADMGRSREGGWLTHGGRR